MLRLLLVKRLPSAHPQRASATSLLTALVSSITGVLKLWQKPPEKLVSNSRLNKYVI